MRLLVVLTALLVSQFSAAAVVGKAEVTKVFEFLAIQLVSDPIQDSAKLRNVIISNPRLEIIDQKGQKTIVGVTGQGICSLFGYKGDGPLYPTLPYSYNDEKAQYFIYRDSTVRQLSNQADLKTIKSASCERN